MIDDGETHWIEVGEKREFFPFRKEDAFVKATGKFDHGRTRGVGGRVGHQAHFCKNCSQGRMYIEDDLIAMKEHVMKETTIAVQELVKEQVVEQMKASQSQSSHDQLELSKSKDVFSTHPSENSYVSESNDPFLELEVPVPCRLAVYIDEAKVVVAEGTVWPWVEGKKMHNISLSRQNGLMKSLLGALHNGQSYWFYLKLKRLI